METTAAIVFYVESRWQSHFSVAPIFLSTFRPRTPCRSIDSESGLFQRASSLAPHERTERLVRQKDFKENALSHRSRYHPSNSIHSVLPVATRRQAVAMDVSPWFGGKHDDKAPKGRQESQGWNLLSSLQDLRRMTRVPWADAHGDNMPPLRGCS